MTARYKCRNCGSVFSVPASTAAKGSGWFEYDLVGSPSGFPSDLLMHEHAWHICNDTEVGLADFIGHGEIGDRKVDGPVG